MTNKSNFVNAPIIGTREQLVFTQVQLLLDNWKIHNPHSEVNSQTLDWNK